MNFKELEFVEILDYENYFTIHWKMTKWCNYNCSYCIQNHNKESNKVIYDYNKFIRYAKKINIWMKSTTAPIRLHLIGGEISFMDIIPLLNYIDADNFKKLSLVTNFSGPVKFFTGLRDYCRERGIELQICASLHDEFISVKKFIEKAKEFKDCIHIQFTVTDSNIDNFVELIDLCNEYGIQYKTEGDKKGKRPLQKYDICSPDFPVKAKIRYKNGDEEIIPIPEYRNKIIYEPGQKIKCESNHVFLIDFDGNIYDGTCAYHRRISSIDDSNDDLMSIHLQRARCKPCKRDYCQLCYPVKIYNEE